MYVNRIIRYTAACEVRKERLQQLTGLDEVKDQLWNGGRSSAHGLLWLLGSGGRIGHSKFRDAAASGDMSSREFGRDQIEGRCI